MNENHELPKINEITVHKTDFSRIIDPKKWRPSLSVGPFLPITSNGEGNLPYKIDDMRGSTFVDYSQNFMLI